MSTIANSPPRVLVVEGVDDKHVANHIAKRIELCKSFEVVPKNDVTQVIKSIPTEIKVPGREVIGFMLDANSNVDSRWKAIRHRLGQVSLNSPEKPMPSGTVVDATSTTPRVGIWLMPDNESPGELEDFVAQMIPDEDPVWPLAQQYIKGIPEPARKFTPKKARRAEVYAWLAAREDPGPMGAAIRKHDLETDGALCKEFSEWLRALFG